MAKPNDIFTINGKAFTITQAMVEKAVAGVRPEQVRDHAVTIGEALYPVKQVIALVTKLDRLDFQTAQARSVLQRLGFGLFRRSAG